MKAVLFFCLYLVLFSSSFYLYKSNYSDPTVEDAGRLLPAQVKAIEPADGEEVLREIVQQNRHVTIAGMQHSQGGHTYYPGAVMINMKPFNKILAFQPEKKVITVQAGATWDDIQQHINPYGLAVKVMQSQNIFTVGGSLSVNVHGRDIRHESLIDTVQSFRLLKPDGSIVRVSRTENKDLFPYVIGGYGLFGVILDVTISLTDDELYQKYTKELDYKEYSRYFQSEVKENPAVKMHLARISVAPSSFLRDMYVTDYVSAADQEKLEEYRKLKGEGVVALPKLFLGLSRYSNWGKDAFWAIQKEYMLEEDGAYESRNNVMRSETDFMAYESGSRTEVLQEYFVPVDEFTAFIDDLREILQKEDDFNLLNITIRYVEKSDQAVLSYAKEDMFALVLLLNQGRSEEEVKKSGDVVRKMIDVTLKHRGSYYLPYYSFPSQEQFQEAYPHADAFFRKKHQVDPDERFINYFYEEYGK